MAEESQRSVQERADRRVARKKTPVRNARALYGQGIIPNIRVQPSAVDKLFSVDPTKKRKKPPSLNI